MAQVKWFPQKFITDIRRHMGNNVVDGANILRKYVIKDISHQGKPGYHSKPGNPPFRQSGALIKSYKVRPNRRAMEAFLESNLPYARYLEQGTSKMAARPHLRRNLITHQGEIAQALTRRMP